MSWGAGHLLTQPHDDPKTEDWLRLLLTTRAPDRFYGADMSIADHPLIEFAGLVNE
jgi:hypothetical protein